MGFLLERDFSRDQPCETRLLARLESHMVSWEKFAEVVGTLELGEFRKRGTFCTCSVPYILLCTYRASLVSNVSRDRACETRPRSLGLVSRLVSQGRSRSETQLSTLIIEYSICLYCPSTEVIHFPSHSISIVLLFYYLFIGQSRYSVHSLLQRVASTLTHFI
jgi:hypothetical protein